MIKYGCPNSSIQFEYSIVDCIFPASGNRQNTGSDTFHGEESTKRIIRPFIRLIYDKLNPFKNGFIIKFIIKHNDIVNSQMLWFS